MNEELFERLIWVLDYYDDEKEKDQSFEVTCNIVEKCGDSMFTADLNPANIVGYGADVHEAHEEFKKRFHALAHFIALMDKSIQEGKKTSLTVEIS